MNTAARMRTAALGLALVLGAVSPIQAQAQGGGTVLDPTLDPVGLTVSLLGVQVARSLQAVGLSPVSIRAEASSAIEGDPGSSISGTMTVAALVRDPTGAEFRLEGPLAFTSSGERDPGAVGQADGRGEATVTGVLTSGAPAARGARVTIDSLQRGSVASGVTDLYARDAVTLERDGLTSETVVDRSLVREPIAWDLWRLRDVASVTLGDVTHKVDRTTVTRDLDDGIFEIWQRMSLDPGHPWGLATHGHAVVGERHGGLDLWADEVTTTFAGNSIALAAPARWSLDTESPSLPDVDFEGGSVTPEFGER